MTQEQDVTFVIMGTAEVADYLTEATGQPWTSRKVAKYVQRSRERGFPPGAFPEPDVQLGCGSIWLQDTIDAYIQAREIKEVGA